MTKVFIDGSAGTTGLRIHERLSDRKDLSLITLPDEVRKDPAARREAINGADIVFLCLPDAAAIEAVAMCDNPNVRIIDTSTAHRTNPDWVYGFAELTGYDRVASAKRVANPGCHASGFLALTEPRVRAVFFPWFFLHSLFHHQHTNDSEKIGSKDHDGDKEKATVQIARCLKGVEGAADNERKHNAADERDDLSFRGKAAACFRIDKGISPFEEDRKNEIFCNIGKKNGQDHKRVLDLL